MNKVSPNDKSTPFVTFPGNEIKDLYVHEQQPSKAVEQAKPAPAIPAVSSGPPAKAPVAEPSALPKPPVTTSEPTKEKKSYEKPRGDSNNTVAQAHGSGGRGQGRGSGREGGRGRGGRNSDGAHRERSNAQPTNAPTNAGTGEHLLKSREQKPVDARPADSQPNVKTEFDFTAGLKAFNKEAVLAEVQSSAAVPKQVTKYSKDDFFDSFSSDAGADGRGGRLTFAEERKLNQDTFGVSSLRSGHRGRGGGRGRGRSGRGGYRNSQNSNVTKLP